MTFILFFAMGFFAAAVLDELKPGMFGKFKIAAAGAIAVIAGAWDKMPWSGF